MLKVSNNARANLTSAISDSSTTITLTTGKGALFPTTGNFRVTVWSSTKASPGDDSGMEIIEISARSGDTLTIDSRAKEDTTQSDHAIGDKVGLLVTKGIIEEMQTYIVANAVKGDTGP